MRAQRPAGAAPCVAGRAEALPFADGSFDAAMAILSDHHWEDRAAGLRELRRVARRAVVFQWDPAFAGAFWLLDYLPGLLAGVERDYAAARAALGVTREVVVPIPHDCRDGFLMAYWRRPEAYLDPVVRANISVFALAQPGEVDAMVAALRADLESGAWAERHAGLLACEALDLGYRVLVAG
jgi:SAM-dependent methyltransferase